MPINYREKIDEEILSAFKESLQQHFYEIRKFIVGGII